MDKNRENFRKVTAEAECGSMRGEKLSVFGIDAGTEDVQARTDRAHLARRLDGL